MTVRERVRGWLGRGEEPAERYVHAYAGAEDALRSTWTAHWMIHRLFVDEPLLAVPTLDIACGTGAGTAMLAEATGQPVVGVDYSLDAIAWARAHNARPLTSFETLDVTTEDGLERLVEIVEERGIRQAFLIEAIEHLPTRVGDRLIGRLLEAGVERIRISTPYERETGHGDNHHHVTAFTPEHYAAFAARWGARPIGYLRFVTRPGVLAMLDAGSTPDDVLAAYATDDPAQAGSYLIAIG